jgi:hypothetical protein
MKENAIRESIGRYTPGIHSERRREGFIRNKKGDHTTLFNQERAEAKRIRESIEDVITDSEFFNILENYSIRGEIVSTTADLLGFS